MDLRFGWLTNATAVLGNLTYPENFKSLGQSLRKLSRSWPARRPDNLTDRIEFDLIFVIRVWNPIVWDHFRLKIRKLQTFGPNDIALVSRTSAQKSITERKFILWFWLHNPFEIVHEHSLPQYSSPNSISKQSIVFSG